MGKIDGPDYIRDNAQRIDPIVAEQTNVIKLSEAINSYHSRRAAKAPESGAMPRQSQSPPSAPDLPLRQGGSDGTSGGMEQRIANLEARFDRIENKLDAMGETLTEIRVELKAKPSVAGLWGMIATVIGVALAIAFGTFAIADYAGNSGQSAPQPIIIQVPAQPASGAK